MKVSTFILDNPEYINQNAQEFVYTNAIFRLPILEAYAIHHADLNLFQSISVDEIPREADFSLKRNKWLFSMFNAI